MKVFIIAYACEPNKQSEPGLGWNISGEIARRHDVTVLTRANNRTVIEDYVRHHPDGPHAKIRFLYHDKGGLSRCLKKRVPLGGQLYFSTWLKSAAKRFKSQFCQYDIVHQLTFSPFFVKPWGAAYTDRYVWGPIGGGGGIDARFPKGFAVDGFQFKFIEWLYKVISLAVYSPFAWQFKALRGKCAAITFKAKSFSVGFPIAPGQISAITQETGYDGEIPPRQYNPNQHSLKIIAVGRMIPHKGFEYAIKGFQKFLADGGKGEFHIFGDGPLRAKLESIASLSTNDSRLTTNDYQLTTKPTTNDSPIIFHGNVPNAEVHAMLDVADVFLHGSFIEAAAWSILEAMIHGVPIVCQNRSGMADMVADDCGTKVNAVTPDELINGFASALSAYYTDPSLVRRHGETGQRRVREQYTWTRCGDLINEVYAKINQ